MVPKMVLIWYCTVFFFVGRIFAGNRPYIDLTYVIERDLRNWYFQVDVGYYYVESV